MREGGRPQCAGRYRRLAPLPGAARILRARRQGDHRSRRMTRPAGKGGGGAICLNDGLFAKIAFIPCGG
jgi:hypothetical protein